jgi:hypothetical protein
MRPPLRYSTTPHMFEGQTEEAWLRVRDKVSNVSESCSGKICHMVATCFWAQPGRHSFGWRCEAKLANRGRFLFPGAPIREVDGQEVAWNGVSRLDPRSLYKADVLL